MLVSFIAFGLAFAWLVVHRYRLEGLEECYENEGLASALEARRSEVTAPVDVRTGFEGDRSPSRAPAEAVSQ
jgi:hypothetical protein